MRLQLREYQIEAVQSIYEYFDENSGNPIIVLPTASGKSLVMAQFIEEVLMEWPDHKILILTHVKELIEQNYRELLEQWPFCIAGIYSAGMARRDTVEPVIFAGIQSIYRRPQDFGSLDLVLIDECHLVPRDNTTMYRSFLKSVGRINPKIKVIGLTATHYRLDSGLLTVGDDRLFTDVCYEAGVRRLIDEGYLAPLITKSPRTIFDLNNLHTRAGEFIPEELAERMDRDELTISACREIVKYGQDRKSWIIYCINIKHAHNVAHELWLNGITAAAVSSDDSDKDRGSKIQDFKDGKLQAITNCNILTTGFNHPGIDLLVMLRPTKSTGLYVQIAGRGMRPAPGKENCLVLDFSGNVERHGPIDLISPEEKRKNNIEGVAPTKICPRCRAIIFAGFKLCPDCGYEFPIDQPKHDPTATTKPIISEEISTWMEVSEVNFSKHWKGGHLAARIAKTAPTLRVDYTVEDPSAPMGYIIYSEWVCPEHTGFAKQKASQWFRRHGVDWREIPVTVDEALERCYTFLVPGQIMVRRDGKYWRIVLEKDLHKQSEPEPEPETEEASPELDDLPFDEDVPF